MHAQWIIPLNSLADPVIVFLHDALGSIGQWKGFPEKLCTKVNLKGLVIERQGHGKSSALKGVRSTDYLSNEANTLAEVLDRLNVSHPILLGFSDGATIALLYAAQFRISGGIAIAPHTFVESRTIKGIKMALFKERTTLQKLQGYHLGVVQNLWNAWWKTWLSDEFVNWNVTGILANILDPFLVIQTKDDPFGTLEQIKVIERKSGADVFLKIMDGSAHDPHHQNTQETIDAVVHFIDNLHA